MELSIRTVSSLEKVFMDEALAAPPLVEASAARGEVFSFQLAAYSSGTVRLKVTADAPFPVELRDVVSTPVEVPKLGQDPYFERTAPGLYPDCLRPLPGNHWRLPPRQWRALWVTVRVPEDAPAGRHAIRFRLEDVGLHGGGAAEPFAATAEFTLETLPFALPAGTLLCYEWFHADCLATRYRVPCWSEEHWRIMENFVRNGAAHGLNVLLTPLWTPPLDTAPGGERPTVQLLDIRWEEGRYRFDFRRLERYFEMGRRCGITHFAMSHAFTQWGARATPKIVVRVDGREEKRFGWHVASDDPAYADFLRQLMPELLAVIRRNGLEKNVFFSVSDEPRLADLESYSRASALLKSVLEGLPTLDALSDFAFYQHGLVARPAVAINHIEPFVGQVPELWAYYCVSQEALVPNRFCAMPSARNRIMGLMLYWYDAVGFLQWGFNFYYSQYSLEEVDPFTDACAGRWVPGGDPFIVYPGPDGEAYDSLRHEVFFEGLQDLRALRALEVRIGRDAVRALVQQDVRRPISMTEYPRSADWLLQLRERVNRKLAELA